MSNQRNKNQMSLEYNITEASGGTMNIRLEAIPDKHVTIFLMNTLLRIIG